MRWVVIRKKDLGVKYTALNEVSGLRSRHGREVPSRPHYSTSTLVNKQWSTLGASARGKRRDPGDFETQLYIPHFAELGRQQTANYPSKNTLYSQLGCKQL